MGLLILLLIGIALGAYLVFFSLANSQTISLSLLGGWYLQDVAIWQLVVTCLAIGLIIAVLLMWPAQLRTLFRARNYRNELKRAQALLEEERRKQAPSTMTAAAPSALITPLALSQPEEDAEGKAG